MSLTPVPENEQLQPGEVYQVHLEPQNRASRAVLELLPGGLFAAILRYFTNLGTVEFLDKQYDARKGVLVLRFRAVERAGLTVQAAPVLLIGGVAAALLGIFGAWGLVVSLKGLFREGGATVHALVWVGLGAFALLVLLPSAQSRFKALGVGA